MKESALVEVLFEEMNGKFDAILEYVQDIPDIKERVTRLEDKVDELELNMTAVKFILKNQNRR